MVLFRRCSAFRPRREQPPDPIGKRLAAGGLGLLLFLAAGVCDAQEPARPDKKLFPEWKSGMPPLDPKALEDPRVAAAAAAFLEKAYEGETPPESVRMLAAILRGSRMGPGEGWFGPAQTRFDWKWLVARYGVDAEKGGIPRSRVRGPDALFARLDRNKDGVITPDDLDWSERSPYVQMSQLSSRLFRKLNAEENGRLTKEELAQFFEKAAKGKDHLSADDFNDALLAGMFAARGRSSEGPKQAVLLRGLFAGELGSMNEGPRVNQPAPDFTLKTVDGKSTVQLGKLIGPKPVVLIFGSFT